MARKLELFDRGVKKDGRALLEKSAAKAERRARARAPEETGALKQSIRVTFIKNDPLSGDLVYQIGSNLRYALYTELGPTAKQPWLRRTMKTERTYVRRKMREITFNLLRRLRVI